MNTRDNRHLSEEEADAEIERTQQKITLALQQIDENFATCNQIVTSKIGPGIDQYGESSHQVWDFSKTWLYFFNTMNKETATYSVQDDESEYSTNRPAFDESSTGSAYRLIHNISANDITNLTGRQGLIRSRLRQPTSASSMETTTEDNRIRQVFTPVRTAVSMSSGSSASDRNAMSPPQTMAFSLPSGSLMGTPIREQAKVLTEHTLRQVGIHSSDSESSETKRAKQQRAKEDKESYGRAWGESNMDKDDPESRAKFEAFLQRRTHQVIVEGEEFQPVRPPQKSPSNRTPVHRQQEQEEAMLVGTPTMERVLAIKQKDLRGKNLSDFDVDSFQPSTPLRAGQQEEEEEEIGAFEFSDTLQQQRNSILGTPTSQRGGNGRNSMLGTPSSTRSDMTMMQGQYTSMVPAHFDLHYFPEKFRVPPGSVMLTKVYHEFNDRPGTMLTVKDVIEHINDPNYSEDYVTILISLLSRKKYLKKVGNHDAWVIRR